MSNGYVAPVLAGGLVAFLSALAKKKEDKTEGSGDAVKLEKEKLKNLKTRYKGIKDRKDISEGSPMYDFTVKTLTDIDTQLSYLDNPDIGDYDTKFISSSQEGFQAILDNHGGAIEAAGVPIDPDLLLKHKGVKAEESKHKAYKNMFDKLPDADQESIIANNKIYTDMVGSGVFDSHHDYVMAIRKQFEAEDAIIKNNPAVAENIKNVRRELQLYYASAVWESFKQQNPTTAPLKSFLVEDMGIRPLFEMTPEVEAKYNAMQQEYSAMFKKYTGFDVAFQPTPVSFEKNFDQQGNLVSLNAIQGVADENALLWNYEQIKDRNEIIEYASAGRVTKDIHKATGYTPTEITSSINNILTNPDELAKYPEGFVFKLEEMESLLTRITEDLALDPTALTYGKTEFLVDVPDDPKATIDPYIDKEFEDKIPESTTEITPLSKYRKIDMGGI